MDLQKKLTYAEMHIKSISEHRDVDASVRKAALSRVMSMCSNEMQMIDGEINAEIASLTPKKEE